MKSRWELGALLAVACFSGARGYTISSSALGKRLLVQMGSPRHPHSLSSLRLVQTEHLFIVAIFENRPGPFRSGSYFYSFPCRLSLSGKVPVFGTA